MNKKTRKKLIGQLNDILKSNKFDPWEVRILTELKLTLEYESIVMMAKGIKK